MKRKLWLYIICFAGMIFSLCSCSYMEADRNLSNLAKIRKGMDKKQVLAIMGEPVKGEAYCNDRVWYYFTQTQWMDGLTTRDECTPIVFDYFGKVAGWGKDFNTGIYEFSPDAEKK
ncbi:MAG: DUF3192 domain-containing protein [Lentisphaeria bacterium]|nr:DUF3192 domain-containing protein [Lentisphaeria bacterium]